MLVSKSVLTRNVMVSELRAPDPGYPVSQAACQDVSWKMLQGPDTKLIWQSSGLLNFSNDQFVII